LVLFASFLGKKKKKTKGSFILKIFKNSKTHNLFTFQNLINKWEPKVIKKSNNLNTSCNPLFLTRLVVTVFFMRWGLYAYLCFLILDDHSSNPPLPPTLGIEILGAHS
jgi:hypothetical protein